MKSLGVAVARQVARENLLAARTKEPNKRTVTRKKSTTPTTTPPNPALITHPGSGPGKTAPTGVDALLNPLLDPLEGLSMLNCGKLGLEGRSRLPALKGGRGAC